MAPTPQGMGPMVEIIATCPEESKAMANKPFPAHSSCRLSTAAKCLKELVGAGRFERPTPCAQGRCATRLRYAPTCEALFILKHFLTRHTPRTKTTQNKPDRGKTVTKPHQLGLSVSKL